MLCARSVCRACVCVRASECVCVRGVEWRKVVKQRSPPPPQSSSHLCGVGGRGRLGGPGALLLACGVLAANVLQLQLFLPGQQVVGLLKQRGAGPLLVLALRLGGRRELGFGVRISAENGLMRKQQRVEKLTMPRWRLRWCLAAAAGGAASASPCILGGVGNHKRRWISTHHPHLISRFYR